MLIFDPIKLSKSLKCLLEIGSSNLEVLTRHCKLFDCLINSSQLNHIVVTISKANELKKKHFKSYPFECPVNDNCQCERPVQDRFNLLHLSLAT